MPPARDRPRRSVAHVRALALAGIVVVLAALPGRAVACGFPAGTLPPGSYAYSCENCTVAGVTLTCDCRTLSQTLQRTELNIGNCRSDPANDNGELVCDRCSTRGACCHEDGTCSEGSFAACEDTGSFKGDFSSCGQVTCPAAGEVRWTNPDGGSFTEETNWAGDAVPETGDIGVFDLPGTYTVTLGGTRTLAGARVRGPHLTVSSGSLQLQRPAGLLVGDAAELVLAAATVNAANVAIGDAGEARALVRVQPGSQLAATNLLSVGGVTAATLEIAGGAATAGDLTAGGPEDGVAIAVTSAAGPRAVDDPEGRGALLRVTTSGGTTGTLEASRMTLGPGGVGEAIVEAGASASIGGLTTVGAGGQGILRVRGRDTLGRRSLLASGGALVVGDDAGGTLVVLDTGRLTALDVVLGATASGDGAAAIAGTDGVLTHSSLEAAGLVTVGQGGTATLDVFDFGELRAGNLTLGSEASGRGVMTVTNFGQVVVAGGLTVGGSGGGTLRVTDSGRVAAASTYVASEAGLLPASRIEVVGRSASVVTGYLRVGVAGTVAVSAEAEMTGLMEARVGGALTITNGGRLDATSLYVEGALDVAGGASRLTTGTAFIAGDLATTAVPASARVDGTTWRVDGDLGVAFVTDISEPAGGRLVLANGGTVDVSGTLFCLPGCTISGNGTLRIGTTAIEPRGHTLTNLGVISPGSSPGTLRIEDHLELGPSSRLVMEVGGTAPGQMDVLDVAGDLVLGGTLDLRFVDGYAPRAGDVLPILRAGGAVTGGFAAVSVRGLEAGAEFSLDVAEGGVVVAMRRDATPLRCTDPADADGDGIVDCADDCPETANAPAAGAAQADLDGDGRGDACDPCTGGVPILKPVLVVNGRTVTVAGTLALPADRPIDPTATGMRLLVEDGAGRVLLDGTAAPGTFDPKAKRGWKKSTYKGAKGDAVRRARVVPGSRPGAPLGFTIGAVLRAVPRPVSLPLRATLVLDPPAATDGRCGEIRFTGPARVSPVCRAVRRGRVVCRMARR